MLYSNRRCFYAHEGCQIACRKYRLSENNHINVALRLSLSLSIDSQGKIIDKYDSK